MRITIRRFFAFWTQERSLSALLIYLLVGIFVWLPLSEHEFWQEFTQDFIFNLILLAGCFSVLTNRSVKFVLYLLAINAFVFRGLEFLSPHPVIVQIEIYMSALFFMLLGGLIMKYVFQDDESTAYRIQGAIAVYIIFGLICALIYHAIYLSNTNAFNFTSTALDRANFAHFLYFSFTIQTTVGPGDIFPISPWSKSMVIFESIFGMLYPVVIIARLVTLEIETTKQRGLKKKEAPKPKLEHHLATKIKEPHPH